MKIQIMGVLRMKMIKLNKAFNYTPTENKGIFYYLAQLQDIDLPWGELAITSQLDYYYHLNHSGGKNVSPLIDSFLYEDEIPPENLSDIASIIYSLFGQTWERLWGVYVAEYNPINNYDMTESEGEARHIGYGRTDTRTDNLTETDTPGVSVTESESIYGFNSESASPSNTKQTTQTGHNTIANTGTQANVASGADDITVNRTLTRSGNIGVTTSQQMIQSEIELWQWNFFKNVIFPNIDGVLTISIY